MENRIAQEELKITPLILLLILIVGTVGWWTFAFINLPATSPEWLRRAQYVCFGSTETGLPNAGGWLMLTVAPLSLLFALLVVFKQEIVDCLGTLLRNTSYKVISLFLIALFLMQVVWIVLVVRERLQIGVVGVTTEVAFADSYPKTSKALPAFSLIDQYGKEITEKSFLGKKVILTFLYSHCATVCPILLRNVQQAILNSADKSTVVLIVTLDPWRDKPSSLPSMAKEWKLGENAHILSGEVDVVNGVIKQFNVPTNRDQKNGEVIHPAIVYIVNTQGVIEYTLNGPSGSWISESLRRIS